jgi:Niemann-Pick C1 protein
MDVAERIGRTLKYAGASITVTSLTDIVAFAVGTTTVRYNINLAFPLSLMHFIFQVMPSLKSFCFFASMGIFFLYIFVVTFFVSCVAVDEYRIQSKRDGCICIQHNNWKPNSCSQRDFQKLFFGKVFSPILLKPPVKVNRFIKKKNKLLKKLVQTLCDIMVEN